MMVWQLLLTLLVINIAINVESLPQTPKELSCTGACACRYMPSSIPPGIDFYQSLVYGSDNSSIGGSLSWHSGIMSGSSPGNRCNRQGVLRVGTPPTGTTKIYVYIDVCYVDQWTFHIGDESTSDGWGVASSSEASINQGWIAEIHNRYNQLLIYENVNWKNFYNKPVPSIVIPDYFTPWEKTTMRISIDFQCNRIEIAKLPNVAGSTVMLKNNHMFENDNEWYIGLNRVVGTHLRNGRGACAVGVDFASPAPPGSCYPPGTHYC